MSQRRDREGKARSAIYGSCLRVIWPMFGLELHNPPVASPAHQAKTAFAGLTVGILGQIIPDDPRGHASRSLYEDYCSTGPCSTDSMALSN